MPGYNSSKVGQVFTTYCADCTTTCFFPVFQNAFKAELPCIANCMVIGDKRKFLTILIALRSEVSVWVRRRLGFGFLVEKHRVVVRASCVVLSYQDDLPYGYCST